MGCHQAIGFSTHPAGGGMHLHGRHVPFLGRGGSSNDVMLGYSRGFKPYTPLGKSDAVELETSNDTRQERKTNSGVG